MKFVSIRLITDNVKPLVDFYAEITGMPPRWGNEEFAELVTPAGTLAIASTRTVALFGANAAHAADNHSVIVEFRVDDVDSEYQKLLALDVDVDFVKEPTTMPWGNRSLLFRDPDGNVINFFTPVTPEAHRRNPR
jgi:catechol 2,3-dioxygenase-like lactoylglutathione lyase family enzyme